MLRAALRVLDARDLSRARRICDLDPVANVFVASRLRAHGVPGRGEGGELWGFVRGGELASLCWSGANLVPVQADDDALDAFAARARRQGRQCSSLVGPASAVLGLWSRLEPHWGGAREVRGDQPLMALTGPPLVPADPAVRASRPEELDLVVPACVAMFTEEVGYSPVGVDGGRAYTAQVTSMVRSGRSLVRVDGRPAEVVFKAELGSVTEHVAQVQGVWVAPRHRGRGLAAPGMAAVAGLVRARFAPAVSLYVNGYNARAVHVYERVGFRRVGTFATVLF